MKHAMKADPNGLNVNGERRSSETTLLIRSRKKEKKRKEIFFFFAQILKALPHTRPETFPQIILDVRCNKFSFGAAAWMSYGRHLNERGSAKKGIIPSFPCRPPAPTPFAS